MPPPACRAPRPATPPHDLPRPPDLPRPRASLATVLTIKQGLPILELPHAAAWEQWLHAHHRESNGVWLKIAKKGSPVRTATYPDALALALCFGWIDGQRAAHDEHFFLQRFTRRGPRSKWSEINREKAEQLTAEGRMKPAGQAEVEAAKADGRWAAAYPSQKRIQVPDDFQRQLDEHPDANAFFQTLTGASRYAFLYRLHNVTRPETRATRIASYIERLSERRTL